MEKKLWTEIKRVEVTFFIEVIYGYQSKEK